MSNELNPCTQMELCGLTRFPAFSYWEKNSKQSIFYFTCFSWQLLKIIFSKGKFFKQSFIVWICYYFAKFESTISWNKKLLSTGVFFIFDLYFFLRFDHFIYWGKFWLLNFNNFWFFLIFLIDREITTSGSTVRLPNETPSPSNFSAPKRQWPKCVS